MSHIVLIASNSSIAYWGKQLEKELPSYGQLTIVTAYMEQAVEYARHSLPEDTDVIIARGNTAQLLKSSRLSIPIVTIPIGDYELIHSIETAKALYETEDIQIAYIGLEDVIRSVRRFLNLMHRKIKLYSAASSQDIQNSILKAKQEGVSVVIGGIYTEKLAKIHGLKCVALKSSFRSLKEACNRALEIQKGVQLQKKRMQERITTMNIVAEGLVSLNENGQITSCNMSAQNIFKLSSSQILGQPYTRLFRENEQAIINRLFLYGKEITGHTLELNGQSYTANFYPVLMQKKTKGSIISIQSQEITKTHSSHPQTTQSINQTPLRNTPETFQSLVGEHPAFLAATSIAAHISPFHDPVLIIGEEGAGKTALARCIHHLSPRSSGLFLIRDGRTLILEDLLSAHKGTLYLHHPESLSPTMIAILTEVLNQHSVPLPDGSRQSIDVRLITGSSCHLSKLLDKKLYYLLSTFQISMPSLRQRGDDSLLLFYYYFNHFNQKSNHSLTLPPDSDSLIRSCPWPGNLNQLINTCRRLSHTGSTFITSDMLSACLNEESPYTHLTAPSFSLTNTGTSIPQHKGIMINKQFITWEELQALDNLYHGQKEILAQKLGISRSTLWRFLKQMKQQSQ